MRRRREGGEKRMAGWRDVRGEGVDGRRKGLFLLQKAKLSKTRIGEKE